MNIDEKIVALVDELVDINKHLEPLDTLETKMGEQIKQADKEFAYTNCRPDTKWTISVSDWCGDKSVEVNFEMDTSVLLKAIQENGTELRQRRDDLNKKLNQIKDIVEG